MSDEGRPPLERMGWEVFSVRLHGSSPEPVVSLKPRKKARKPAKSEAGKTPVSERPREREAEETSRLPVVEESTRPDHPLATCLGGWFKWVS